MFSSEVYINRRKKLIAEMENSGVLLLMGNTEVPMNYKSNPYRFRQDSNFLYFVGIDQPGLAVTIDTFTGEVVLYGKDISIEDAVWTGPVPGLSEWAERSGITKTRDIDSLLYHLQRAPNFKFLPPYPADRKNYLAHVFSKVPEDVDDTYTEDFVNAVVKLRSIKSEEEICQIEDALNRATSKLHVEAMKMALPGEFEYRIAGQIEGIMLKNLCYPAYSSICSVHGEILHNPYYTNQLKADQLLLVDAGAENKLHYASDITRTTPVGGKFTQKQKEIYEIVLQSQEQSIAMLKPGITYKEVHISAAKIITAGLIDLGLMKGDVDVIVESGAHALFFPHGLGHMLGLDVHDMEDLGEDNVGYGDELERSEQFGTGFLRLARKLKPGFVLTVEPGIYFIPMLIEKWRSEKKFLQFINYKNLDDYMNFGGIRIEDNVLITNESNRILGMPVPKTVSEIEDLFG